MIASISIHIAYLCYNTVGAIAFTNAAFGAGTGAIILNYVQCRGNETSLISCSHSIPNNYDSHSEDAGVRCLPGFAFCSVSLEVHSYCIL